MLELLFLEHGSAWYLFYSFDHFDWINWRSLYFLALILREASINNYVEAISTAVCILKKNMKKCDCFIGKCYLCIQETEREGHSQKKPIPPQLRISETCGTILSLVKISDQVLAARNWVYSYYEERQQQIECSWEILLVFQEWRHVLTKMVLPVLGKHWIRKCPCLKSLQFKGKGRHTFEQTHVIIPNKMTWVWF